VRTKLVLLSLLLGLTACATGSRVVQGSESGATYYRVFRGVKRAELSKQEFHKQLEDVFIPALPRIHGDDGLKAYLPALPPETAPAGFPDELAIVAWESEDLYKRAFAKRGLKGYVVVATDDWEIAWMNWESEQAMSAAMDSPEGKRIVEDAGKWMATAQWSTAGAFAGKVKVSCQYSEISDSG
jgi:hypothetical protein